MKALKVTLYIMIAMLVSLLLVVSGCSAIKEIAGNDLTRTSELASKYGKPEVKQCSDFLVMAMNKLNNDEASLQALLAEDTQGIFSAALKAVLVKEKLASLNDPSNADAFRKDFDNACRGVAGQIMLNLVRDAAKIGSRIR